jgi:hypothetical protein
MATGRIGKNLAGAIEEAAGEVFKRGIVAK